MPTQLRIEVNDSLYLKDPEDTELGRALVAQAVLMIDDLGFEKFTFKKLAEAIGSTEASMYRYFESKHKLLGYLICWYWSWTSYLTDVSIRNITDPRKKLRTVLRVLADSSKDDPATAHIDEAALHRIMLAESGKAYYTKLFDEQERKATFEGYNEMVTDLASIIKEIAPRYKQPRALATTLIHTVQRQAFYASHVPEVTEVKIKRGDTKEVARFAEDIALAVL